MSDQLQPPPLPETPEAEESSRRFPFKMRVFFRVLMTSPILAGFIFAPDRWIRLITALGFLINFLSIELIFAKLRKI